MFDASLVQICFFRSAVRYHGCSALMAEAGHRYIFFVMHQDQG